MSGGRQLDGGPFAEQRLDDRVLVVTGGTQAEALVALDSTSVGLWGSFVNIMTMASHGGEPALTAHAASKGALATEGEHAVQTAMGESEDWLASADSGAAGEHVAPAGASA
jgi:hypothetical protein